MPPTTNHKARGRAPSETDLGQRLEAWLRATRIRQQHLIDHLEKNNEELRTVHEDALSINEALESINEEVTTAQQEFQAMNAELLALHGQLQDKVQQLTDVNDASPTRTRRHATNARGWILECNNPARCGTNLARSCLVVRSRSTSWTLTDPWRATS